MHTVLTYRRGTVDGKDFGRECRPVADQRGKEPALNKPRRKKGRPIRQTAPTVAERAVEHSLHGAVLRTDRRSVETEHAKNAASSVQRMGQWRLRSGRAVDRGATLRQEPAVIKQILGKSSGRRTRGRWRRCGALAASTVPHGAGRLTRPDGRSDVPGSTRQDDSGEIRIGALRGGGMPNYLSPGVYVEEVEAGSGPSRAWAPQSPPSWGSPRRARCNEPTLVSNWTQFAETFGDFVPDTYLAHAVYGYIQNGGSNCFIVRVGGGPQSTNGHSTNGPSRPRSAQAGRQSRCRRGAPADAPGDARRVHRQRGQPPRPPSRSASRCTTPRPTTPRTTSSS